MPDVEEWLVRLAERSEADTLEITAPGRQVFPMLRYALGARASAEPDPPLGSRTEADPGDVLLAIQFVLQPLGQTRILRLSLPRSAAMKLAAGLNRIAVAPHVEPPPKPS